MDGFQQAWSEYGLVGFLGLGIVIALLIYGFKSPEKKGGSSVGGSKDSESK